MRLVDPMLAELEQESAATRRALERVPEAQLSWRPHPKSMTLGQQALHIAMIPGNLASMLSGPGLDAPPQTPHAEPTSLKQILDGQEASLKTAKSVLSDWDDEKALGTWSLKVGGKVVMSAPRIALCRTLVLNHMYHHRGELQVYLRLLNVPVPFIYGPTADENPFL